MRSLRSPSRRPLTSALRHPWLSLSTLAFLACAGAPATHAPRSPSGQATTSATTPTAEPSIAPRLLGWVRLGGIDRVARSLAGLAGGPGSEPGDLRAETLSSLGIPDELAATIAGDRVLVVALATREDAAAEGPADLHAAPVPIVAVPLTSINEAKKALEQVYRRAPDTPGRPAGVSAWDLPDGRRIHVMFDAGRRAAYVAMDPTLAAGAAPALGPSLDEPADGAVLAHAALDQLQARYGDEVSSTLRTALATMSLHADDPVGGFALRGVGAALALAGGARALELRALPGPEGLQLSVKLEGAPGSTVARYVSDHPPGPAWGLALVPEDAVLVHARRVSGPAASAEAAALAELTARLEASAGTPAPGTSNIPDPRRVALEQAAATLTGAEVYAVWPARGGGIGVGGAFQVDAPDAARAAVLQAYRAMGPALGTLVAGQLGLDPTRVVFDITVRPAARQVRGATVDLLELRPRPVSEAVGEDHLLDWLFGPRVTLALASAPGALVWTAGRDWQPRLAALLAAAAGDGAASVEDTPAFATTGMSPEDGRLAVTFVPAAGMAALVHDAMKGVATVSPADQAMLAPFLDPDGANTALVASTRVARDPAAVALDTFIPVAALKEMGGLGGALWRVTLMPLAGAPPLPPLPTPPPALVPPVPGGPSTATR